MKKLWLLLAIVLILSGCDRETPPAETTLPPETTVETLPPMTGQAQELLEKYRGLQEEAAGWRVPTAEELEGYIWYYDGYDEVGNDLTRQLKAEGDKLSVKWTMENGEKQTYEDAPWQYEICCGIGVLTVDFREFAGVRAYNVLVNPDYEMLYIATDITTGQLQTEEEEVPFRFLWKQVGLQPADIVGNWVRTHTEVEGDRVETPKGDCKLSVTNPIGEDYRLAYTDTVTPEKSFPDAPMTITEPAALACFADCSWTGLVETGDGVTRYVGMQAGTLLLVSLYTVDGAPVMGCEYFIRG